MFVDFHQSWKKGVQKPCFESFLRMMVWLHLSFHYRWNEAFHLIHVTDLRCRTIPVQMWKGSRFFLPAISGVHYQVEYSMAVCPFLQPVLAEALLSISSLVFMLQPLLKTQDKFDLWLSGDAFQGGGWQSLNATAEMQPGIFLACMDLWRWLWITETKPGSTCGTARWELSQRILSSFS